jgi:lipoate---protein ligase
MVDGSLVRSIVLSPRALTSEEWQMHGEFKTPGGKLVVVDVEVAEGRLAEVEVSGDFFLYPEEALGDITGALEGMDAGLDSEEIAAEVRAGLRPGAELLGTSPEAIATAVRRALGADAADTKERS